MARRTLVEEIDRLLERAEAEASDHAEDVVFHRESAARSTAHAAEAAARQAETLSLRDHLAKALGR